MLTNRDKFDIIDLQVMAVADASISLWGKLLSQRPPAWTTF
ncbi:hypothetical protein M595_2562 [Lyngbya aestuarii BL J]|uniref:Uncharacterized protein n=1 Tax=Lyngbya aestuarii BL J TaxID=1348334 RepID=U7QM42_9CYAN|nr:hypothetical protein [Lyngbya aestuarii]ERT07461.1 hypothetical protein M595_2562 [Lyngbya aestuarii BL J]